MFPRSSRSHILRQQPPGGHGAHLGEDPAPLEEEGRDLPREEPPPGTASQSQLAHGVGGNLFNSEEDARGVDGP